MSTLLRTLRCFHADRNRVAIALLLLAGGAVFNLLKPWPLAVVLDSVLGGAPLPPTLGFLAGKSTPVVLAMLAASLFVFHSGHGAFNAWQNFLVIQLGLGGLTRIRARLFSRLLRLSLGFHQGTPQGDILHRASWDTFAFQTLFQQGIFTTAQASLSLGLMLMVMWQVNVSLTLASVASVPLVVASMRVFGREMIRRSLAAHQAESQVTSFLQQAITALPLIQSFTREATEAAHFGNKVEASRQQRVAQHGWEVLYGLAVTLAFGVGSAAVIWLGAREVLAGRLTAGQLLVFVTYLTQFYEPLTQFSHLGTTLIDASAGAKRVFELLDSEDEVPESSTAKGITRAGGCLEFEHVSFSYASGRPALTDISLRMEAGTAIAVIGPSGAGKTTLMQLLPRFYDPTHGCVKLDGVDLREWRLEDLRRQVAFVPQEPVILPASIAENIAYARPEASMDDIKAAARAAYATEFIEHLPEGYQTVIGDGAARLSVGEKQRINLARAFLKDAPVIILDEPTSALDAETEALVTESMETLLRGRTALMVAHRFTTIERVGHIVVLEAGRLVDYGSRAALRERPGYYRRLLKLHDSKS